MNTEMADTTDIKPRVVIAGGSGFLGKVLSRFFIAQGMEVVVLSRRPCDTVAEVMVVPWDGENLGHWISELEGATALVNLAGVSVNCRYHARNKALLLDSRVNSTRVLGGAIAQCTTPPRVWLNASTATIYRHTMGPAWDEGGEIGGCPEAKDIFSVQIASEWERVFFASNTPRTRKVALRSAMVLGHGKNSVLPNLLRICRCGLGGPLAGGQQYVSWIHETDFCRAIGWILQHEGLSGPVNLAAPNPVTNTEFMRSIRKVCDAPFGLPASKWMLEVGAWVLRTETELIIKSRRVVPGKLLKDGFQFEYPHLLSALDHLVSQSTQPSQA